MNDFIISTTINLKNLTSEKLKQLDLNAIKFLSLKLSDTKNDLSICKNISENGFHILNIEVENCNTIIESMESMENIENIKNLINICNALNCKTIKLNQMFTQEKLKTFLQQIDTLKIDINFLIDLSNIENVTTKMLKNLSSERLLFSLKTDTTLEYFEEYKKYLSVLELDFKQESSKVEEKIIELNKEKGTKFLNINLSKDNIENKEDFNFTSNLLKEILCVNGFTQTKDLEKGYGQWKK